MKNKVILLSILSFSFVSCANKSIVKNKMLYNNKGMDGEEEIVRGRKWIKQNLEILKNADFLKKLFEKEQRIRDDKDFSLPTIPIKSIDVYYIPERGGELIGFDIELSDGTFKDYRIVERRALRALREFNRDKKLKEIKNRS